MKVLVVNCGSSSLKYQLFEMETETTLAKGSGRTNRRRRDLSDAPGAGP